MTESTPAKANGDATQKKNDSFAVIMVEGIDETQRRLVQSLVKRKAESWWHELLDVWIVQGGSVRDWTNDLSIIITGATKDYFVVLSLPAENMERRVGLLLPSSRKEWLSQVYTRRKFLPDTVATRKIANPSPSDEDPPF
ncbi:hypothetical protein OG836_22490 [Micromonospora zamorensis]|uniref:hypothetical protein n=1 Tax=Micromonospora zamorensis TaxID=709883 RepID=UPI002E1BE9AE